MLEMEGITSQVLHNCAISDSQHAGLYSICGLALRLRDLYKWEKGLDPWVEMDSAEILEWIGEKEAHWDELAERDYSEIKILGKDYDPFDTKAINEVLEPCGLLYGAGYVHSLKPTFFLAVLENKREIVGHNVYILDRELARDLLTVPALSQDNSILIRKESGKLFLWDRIFFIRQSGREALRFALREYGLREEDSRGLQRNLARIFDTEMETYIRHELGEIEDKVFDRQIWREIVAAFPHTAMELLTRTVKDLLADTNAYGTLQHITTERKIASLAFYVAFLEGLRRELFPEIIGAFKEFTRTQNWALIEQAVCKGYDTAKGYADALGHIYKRGKEENDMKWVEEEIKKRLLGPLGFGKVKGTGDQD